MEGIELINKRKLNEKHFLQKDGTIVAQVFSDNVHYLKNGKYEEIDNTLIKEGNVYSNKNNDYKVSFSENCDKSLVKFEKDDYYLDIKLKNSVNSNFNKLNTLGKLTEDILYKNIIPNVDIEYLVLPTKVKETIVLKQNDTNRITFIVNTNLKLCIENNEILAKKDDNIIFKLEKPYMEDSNGKTNSNVKYTLDEKNNNEIILELDKEWLDSGETTYPVYIDPTITNYGQNNSVIDTYIYNGDANEDNSTKPYLKAGVEKINNTYRTNRALIKFDLPKIGTGSEIIYASLSLVGYPEIENQNNYEKLVEIHRITESWTENQAKWSNMSDKFDSKIETIQFIKRSTVIGNDLIPTMSYDYDDITDLVKHWYKDTDNFGIMVKSVEEEYFDDNFPCFFSNNNGIQGENPKPLLVITYRNQNGLENYLDYSKQQFEIGTAYVNTYNGNLIGEFDLGNTVAGKLVENLRLYYNTNDVVLNNNHGFKFSAVETIEKVIIDDNNYYEFVDEDGTIHYFYEDIQRIPKDNVDFSIPEAYDNPDNFNIITKYIDEDGLGLEITETQNSYEVHNKYNYKKTYVPINNSTKYYLSSIEDTDGNTIQILYDSNNKLFKIIDADNSEIALDYTITDAITITSPSSTTVINYNDGKVSSIVSEKGTTSFEYNNNDLIISITDTTGIKYAYEYYDTEPYRIKKVKQYGLNNELGNTLEFKYGFNFTNIIDNNGVNQNLIFDSTGTLCSRNIIPYSDDILNAYSIAQSYGNAVNDRNKITSKTRVTKYIKNYLKNTSFEDNTKIFSETNGMTYSFSDDCAVSGNRSLKLTNSIDNQVIVMGIDGVLEKGKYYTFSGYFKNDKPIELVLGTWDENDNLVEKRITLEVSNDFKRHDVSILHPLGATGSVYIKVVLNQANTTTYIDDIQFEDGEVANCYNVIENSDFSNGMNGWTFNAIRRDYHNLDQYGFPSQTAIPISNVFQVVNFNNSFPALKISMSPIESSNLSKRIYTNGHAGEIYNISFWMKNSGIQGNEHYVYNDVLIYFHPADNIDESCTLRSQQFVPNEKWQYITYKYDALKDFDYVDISFSQASCANEMYITNIMLVKDEQSNFFEYDGSGNIISANDFYYRQEELKYDTNNQLIKSIDFKGKELKYEYSNTYPERLLSTINSDGIAKETNYNSAGQPIKIKVRHVGDDILNNSMYRIRSKGTQKYLKAEYCLVFMEEDLCSNTIWKFQEITANDETKYKIFHNIRSNYMLANSNDQLVLNAEDCCLYLEKNDNGSYYIKSKYVEPITGYDSFKYLKVNSDNTLSFDSYTNSPEYEFYIEKVDQKFLEVNASYTSDNKFMTSIKDSLLNETTFNVNTTNGLVNSVVDAKGNTIYYQYNNKKDISSITEGNRIVNYGYNLQGILSSITQSNRTYNFTYDNFLNLNSVKVGNNITLATTDYEQNNGNITTITYGNNDYIDYEYDEFDRVKRITKMNNQYDYNYDNNGNVSKIVSNDDVEKYYFDLSNRLIMYRNNDITIEYSYDKNDNLTDKKYVYGNNENNSQFIYDSGDKLIEQSDSNIEINYLYDNLGRLVNSTINNILNTTYDYLSLGNRTSYIIESVQVGNDRYKYEYDELYNITKVLLNNTIIHSYEYDEYNQLISEIDYVNNEIIEYSYNEYGNMLNKTIKDFSTNVTKSSKSFTYGNSNWVDQLTSYDNKSITYDTIGNPLTIGNDITLTWTNGRQLATYTDTNKNLNISYTYDENGIRKSKTVNGLLYKYVKEDERIIFEQRGDNLIEYIYNISGLVGFKYNNQMYYYLKTINDDIIGILDSNYNQIVYYEYDSWGNIISIKDNLSNDITNPNNIGLINPFRYRSYYYDSETGLYYLNSRYYNPEIMRFINADNYICGDKGHLTYNLYLYTNNNPITYADKDGHFFGIVVAIVVVATVLHNTKKQKKKAKKEMDELQKIKDVPDATKQLNEVMEQNARALKTQTAGMSYAQQQLYFAKEVAPGSTYDLKEKEEYKGKLFSYEGRILEAQDIGNLNFGYSGRALGMPTKILTIGAGLAQLGDYVFIKKKVNKDFATNCLSLTLCDDPRDKYYIEMGAKIYDSQH